MLEATAASFYLQYLLQAVRGFDVPPAWLDEAAALLQSGQQRVDCALLDQWLLAWARHLPADFTLQIGELVTPAALDILALASISCANLREALDLLCQFELYRLGAFSCELMREDELLAVCLMPTLPQLLSAPLQAEAAFAGWISFGRWLTQAQQHPQSIEFEHAPRLPLARYQQLFQCPVRFNAGRNAVMLSQAQCDLPLPTHNPSVSMLTRQQLGVTVGDYLQGQSWRAAVRLALQSLLPQSEPTLERVALQLGLSADELGRRLRAQGLGFGELLDLERKHLARVYVSSADYPLAQVAQLLGYSEQSAFNRAFRRWYGVSPRVFAGET